MGHRSLASMAALAAVVVVALLAQAHRRWTDSNRPLRSQPARRRRGRRHEPLTANPTCRGYNTDNTVTPFERPKEVLEPKSSIPSRNLPN